MARRLIAIDAAFEPDQAARLKEIAAERRVPVTVVIRDAVDAYLSKHPSAPSSNGGDVDEHVDALGRAVQRLIEEEMGWPAR